MLWKTLCRWSVTVQRAGVRLLPKAYCKSTTRQAVCSTVCGEPAGLLGPEPTMSS